MVCEDYYVPCVEEMGDIVLALYHAAHHCNYRTTNFWHIKSTHTQDLEGRMDRPNTYRAIYRIVPQGFVSRVALYTCVVGGASLFVAHTAAASFFSLFGTQVDAAPAAAAHEVVVHESSQTLPLLRAARNVNPNPSRGGGGPVVVAGVALAPDGVPFDGNITEQHVPASADQISWYIVQEGDTLSQVAGLFDVSVNTIVWANELSHSEDIHPGETLLILPISGVQHTIAEGDTLKSIAKEYGGGAEADELAGLIEEIVEYNGLGDEPVLAVGDVITIPGGMVEVEFEESTTYAHAHTSGSSGTFIHPVPGAVRTQGLHGYNAVDYGAAVGTPVRASDGGTVIVSRVGGWNGGYGNYIVIDHHDGTQTLYAHLSKNVVWQGQSVVSGQKIGELGNTGRSTGPHLHFEVRGSRNPF